MNVWKKFPYLDVLNKMCEHKFEIIEHTADKGIRAYGNTPEQALERAAYGLFSLMAKLDNYPRERKQEYSIEVSDAELLLHGWLSELLYSFEVEGLLPVDFKIVEFEEWRLKASVAVHSIGPEIEWLGSPVKAITFHELKFEQIDDKWIAQAIVDV